VRPDILDENHQEQLDKLPSLPILTPKKDNSWLSGGRGLILGIGLGALLTFGATRFMSPVAKSPQQSQAVASPKTSAPAQSVTVATVQTTPVDRTLKATGTVAAYEYIPVLPQTIGLQIREILVDEGDTVSAGQILARLDDSVLQSQLSQASASVAGANARLAELKAGSRSEEVARAEETVRRIRAEINQALSDWQLAQKRAERNRTLEAEGAIARDRLDEVLNEERSKRSEFEQAQARLGEAQQQLRQLRAGARPEVIAQAQAQLNEALSRLKVVRTQLNQTKIISPVSGKIAERNARVGDTTNAGNPLFRIIEKGRLELRLRVPETQLAGVRPGQQVQITSDADSKVKLVGRVREINPIVDEQSRQARVDVDLPSGDSLKPGMFLRGAIVTNSVLSVTVPMEAVLPQDSGNAIVFVVQPDNTVSERAVTLGQLMNGDKVEILGGVKPGERVVVKGAAYLGDGDKISAK
jgi:HlyD family secretion protein